MYATNSPYTVLDKLYLVYFERSPYKCGEKTKKKNTLLHYIQFVPHFLSESNMK